MIQRVYLLIRWINTELFDAYVIKFSLSVETFKKPCLQLDDAIFTNFQF